MLKRGRKTIAYALIIAIAWSLASPGTPAKAAESLPSEFVKVAENDRLILYSYPNEGEIAVKDKWEGRLWWSNPQDRDTDEIAKGVPKMTLSSQLTIKYVDDRTSVFMANNKTGSINKNGLTSEMIVNGIEFTMDFEKEQFRIPVRYTIEDDYLKAEILLEQIEEYGPNRIVSMGLLPFFGSGGMQEQGYMMVPDGSGALIRFNNGKKFAGEYIQPVYGIDDIYDRSFVESFTEQVMLPVFGVSKPGSGFAAVIANNEAGASIRAQVSGKNTSYNQVYSEYQYRSMGSMNMTQKNFGGRNVPTVERNAANSGNYEVRYYFLDGVKTNYNGMADKYRTYLIEEKNLKPVTSEGDIPFYLDLIGFIKKKKTFLGIPYQKVVPLTDFDDAEHIVDQLNAGGVDHTVVRYSGWVKKGFYEYIPSKAKVESKLGGNKGLSRFADFLSKSGGQLFMNVDFLNVYKAGKGFSKFRDAVMTVVNAPAMQYDYQVNIYNKDFKIDPWYLLSPKSLFKFASAFYKSFASLNINAIALSGVGTKVYSDLGVNGVGRVGTVAKYEEVLAKADNDLGQVMTEGGNAYAVPYSNHIIKPPVYSSDFDIADESIPFYQIVFHGIVPYSGSAVNLSSNPHIERLKNLETGSYPLYTWVAKEASELKNTRFDYLFSAHYSTWIDQAIQDYSEMNQVLSKVSTSTIVHHEKLADGVFRTIYSNGLHVVVNYNAQQATALGRSIEGFGYVVWQGGVDDIESN